METRSITSHSQAHFEEKRPLPPGAGILLACATSLFLWGLIAGVVVIL